nr:hypothetical protein [Fredinandcohnia onubensis]
MGKKRKINSNRKKSSKTRKRRNKLPNLHEGTLDDQNCESQKLENTFITKDLIGDESNEWQQIRNALSEDYVIPDPDIYKELKSYLTNKKE